jgi:hypothetical protein
LQPELTELSGKKCGRQRHHLAARANELTTDKIMLPAPSTNGNTLLAHDPYTCGLSPHWPDDCEICRAAQSGQRLSIDRVPQGALCNRESAENRENRGQSKAAHYPPLGGDSALSALSLLHDAETAIVETLPTGTGQRYRKLFALCRRLKAIPSLASASTSTLRQIIVEWHRRALPTIRTTEFTETWADFLLAWPRVKFAAGQGAVDVAFARAIAAEPPARAAQLYTERPILLLASLCRELQRIAGADEFYLDCRTAGKLIGKDPTTAWRLLNVLCADGILAAGTKGSRATHKASRFRFLDVEQGGTP